MTAPPPPPDAVDLARSRLRDAIDVKQRLLDSPCLDQLVVAAARCTEAIGAGGKLLFFGNGGSAMDAGHLAAELLGRFRVDRPPLPAVSLPDLTAAVTAIGNDYAFAEVFARPLAALARRGDVAVGLTTSGNSPNVLRAVETARELGVWTVVLTGAGGGKVRELADLCVCVPAEDTPRIQEACLHLGHTLCELVERSIFPQLSG